MPVQLTKETLTQLNEAANKATQIIFDHMKDERGVHLETAISPPCFLSGTLILRSTGIDLSKLEPGHPVLVSISNENMDDVVNDTGREVLEFMQRLCPSLGLDPASGWDQSIPDDHQPLLPGIELVRNIEEPFIDQMNNLAIPEEFYPYVAAFTAMKIIKMGSQVLNQDIAKAIALNSLVAGCKTVPYP